VNVKSATRIRESGTAASMSCTSRSSTVVSRPFVAGLRENTVS
jgi:hypothetical protein